LKSIAGNDLTSLAEQIVNGDSNQR
jgi:hypothetical protein